MALLSCRNLSMAYEGHTVISGLSFSVEKGDYLCIVGENGSGKSTLVKSLLGLKKPAAGEIVFGNGLSANGIGYLPQQTDIQKDFPASVREVVLSGCLNKLRGRFFFSKKEKVRAEETMSLLGIADIRLDCYRNLSGGQQQRVLLARALCATESLLLLDEPVSGLDPLVTKEMYGMIQRINKSGITVIMVSHDIPSAVEYANRILHLHGQSFFFGRTEEYIKSDLGSRFLSAERKERKNG